MKETGQEKLKFEVHYEDNWSLITTDNLKEKALDSLIVTRKEKGAFL